MSDMVLCLVAFLICLAFVLALVLILRVSNPGTVGLKEHAEESRKKFVEAKNRREKIGAILYASFIIFRGGYIGLAVPIAGASFTALAAICGGWDIEKLKMLRLLLQDFYEFIENLLRG